MLNDLIINLAEVLFSKKIPFCLYRFPRVSEYRIAISEEFLPHEKNIVLWMAPFVSQSEAQSIYWYDIKEEHINLGFIEKLKEAPTQNFVYPSLPTEISKDQYLNRFDAFMSDFRSRKLEKAILSRVIHVEKPSNFSAVKLFTNLCASYPETFVHLSLHPNSGVWVGATPELLLKKEHSDIKIMALAGTQKKSQGDYHWRNKEMEEHLMVGKYIESAFQRFNYEMTFKDGPKTIETGKVAHLMTDYEFKEKDNVDLRDLLDVLHPTPAVGGFPVDKGVECILQHEGYYRKYYCGFIGQTDFENHAALYVNLRCMQIFDDKCAVFVGGGLTIDSDAEEEWNETILKSKTMIEKLEDFKKMKIDGVIG